MKYFFIFALTLCACAKPQSADCTAGSTATLNGQPETLTNGACSATYTPGSVTVNSKSVPVQSVTICGQSVGYLYNNILYNNANPSVNASSTSPTGFVQYEDAYYVFPTSSSTQCWFNITKGQITPGATPPTF